MTRRIYVRVKTNCSQQEVEDFGNGRFMVNLTCEPYHHKANMELINLMAKRIGIPPLKLKIVAGETSKDKVLEVVY